MGCCLGSFCFGVLSSVQCRDRVASPSADIFSKCQSRLLMLVALFGGGGRALQCARTASAAFVFISFVMPGWVQFEAFQ